MPNDPDAKRLFWFVFASSRGGLNRLKIISALQDSPQNTNQLANTINADYKTIQHHIRVLEKNNLITGVGQKYGLTYFVSTYLEVNMDSFEWVRTKLDKSK